MARERSSRMGVANQIYKAFEELAVACETYEEFGECGKCPMRANCLQDDTVSFGEAVYNTPLESLKKFIAEAERFTDIGSTERTKQ